MRPGSPLQTTPAKLLRCCLLRPKLIKQDQGDGENDLQSLAKH